MQFGECETSDGNDSREKAEEQEFTRGLSDDFEEQTSSK